MHWHILSLITEASPLKNQLTGTAGLLSAPCSCGSHKAQRCLSCKTPLQPLTTFCDGLSLASLLQPPASLPMLLRATTPRSPATTLCQLLVVLSQASFSELQTPPPRREQMTPYFPWHHLLSQAALGAQAGWHSTRQLRLQQELALLLLLCAEPWMKASVGRLAAGSTLFSLWFWSSRCLPVQHHAFTQICGRQHRITLGSARKTEPCSVALKEHPAHNVLG